MTRSYLWLKYKDFTSKDGVDHRINGCQHSTNMKYIILERKFPITKIGCMDFYYISKTYSINDTGIKFYGRIEAQTHTCRGHKIEDQYWQLKLDSNEIFNHYLEINIPRYKIKVLEYKIIHDVVIPLFYLVLEYVKLNNKHYKNKFDNLNKDIRKLI